MPKFRYPKKTFMFSSIMNTGKQSNAQPIFFSLFNMRVNSECPLIKSNREVLISKMTSNFIKTHFVLFSVIMKKVIVNSIFKIHSVFHFKSVSTGSLNLKKTSTALKSKSSLAKLHHRIINYVLKHISNFNFWFLFIDTPIKQKKKMGAILFFMTERLLKAPLLLQ